MNKFFRTTGFYMLIFLVVIGIVKYISGQNDVEQTLTYSQLRTALSIATSSQTSDYKKIDSMTVKFDGYTYLVKGTFAGGKSFNSRLPFNDKSWDLIDESKVPTDVKPMTGD